MHVPSPALGRLALGTAPASTPWFHPPQVVWNHNSIGSTTVVLGNNSKERGVCVWMCQRLWRMADFNTNTFVHPALQGLSDGLWCMNRGNANEISMLRFSALNRKM